MCQIGNFYSVTIYLFSIQVHFGDIERRLYDSGEWIGKYISHCVEFDDKSLEAGSDVLDNIQSISTLLLYFISYIPVRVSEKRTQIHCGQFSIP